MRKVFSILLAVMVLMVAGCGGFSGSKEVTLYGYEEEAPLSLLMARVYGIEEVDAEEELAAEESVLAAVAKDKYAIGYLAALPADDSVKVVPVEPAATPVQVYVAKEEEAPADGIVADFYNFSHNVVGQEVAEALGYQALVPMPLAMCGACVKPAGKMTVALAPELLPLAEALRESYYGYNKQADITFTPTKDVWEALCSGQADMAMGFDAPDMDASKEVDLIAQPAYRVIVHPENPVESISFADFAAILAGEDLCWKQLTK